MAPWCFASTRTLLHCGSGCEGSHSFGLISSRWSCLSAWCHQLTNQLNRSWLVCRYQPRLVGLQLTAESASLSACWDRLFLRPLRTEIDALRLKVLASACQALLRQTPMRPTNLAGLFMTNQLLELVGHQQSGLCLRSERLAFPPALCQAKKGKQQPAQRGRGPLQLCLSSLAGNPARSPFCCGCSAAAC